MEYAERVQEFNVLKRMYLKNKKNISRLKCWQRNCTGNARCRLKIFTTGCVDCSVATLQTV